MGAGIAISGTNLKGLARPTGFEPVAFGSGGHRHHRLGHSFERPRQRLARLDELSISGPSGDGRRISAS